MGNCCRSPAAVARKDVKSSNFSGHGEGRKDRSAASAAGGGSCAGKKTITTVLTEVSKENIEDRFLVDRELGRGEFGVTYLCIDRGTRELLACKSISKRKLRTAVDVDDVRREVAIMKHLPRNSSIVSLKEACEDDNAVHLVMELCEGGELFDRIVARGHYTERAAAAVTRTIVEVVQLCHKHGVIHRDLKPENFLFANKKENSLLKAIDFGLSIFFKPGEKFAEIVGSPYYMAPEVLKRNYGPEIDIWSAGVILYILLCGVPPFWAESEQGVAQAIIRGIIDFKREPWPNVSDSAKSLVRQMLEPDPKLRLTAKQVLEHSWLQNAKKAPNVPLGDVVKSRLKQFSMMNRFKRKALRVIADFLSVEEVEDIRETFIKIDTDNDGIVSIEELKSGLQKFGSQLGESELQMLIEAGVQRTYTAWAQSMSQDAALTTEIELWKKAEANMESKVAKITILCEKINAAILARNKAIKELYSGKMTRDEAVKALADQAERHKGEVEDADAAGYADGFAEARDEYKKQVDRAAEINLWKGYLLGLDAAGIQTDSFLRTFLPAPRLQAQAGTGATDPSTSAPPAANLPANDPPPTTANLPGNDPSVAGA